MQPVVSNLFDQANQTPALLWAFPILALIGVIILLCKWKEDSRKDSDGRLFYETRKLPDGQSASIMATLSATALIILIPLQALLLPLEGYAMLARFGTLFWGLLIAASVYCLDTVFFHNLVMVVDLWFGRARERDAIVSEADAVREEWNDYATDHIIDRLDLEADNNSIRPEVESFVQQHTAPSQDAEHVANVRQGGFKKKVAWLLLCFLLVVGAQTARVSYIADGIAQQQLQRRQAQLDEEYQKDSQAAAGQTVFDPTTGNVSVQTVNRANYVVSDADRAAARETGRRSAWIFLGISLGLAFMIALAGQFYDHSVHDQARDLAWAKRAGVLAEKLRTGKSIANPVTNRRRLRERHEESKALTRFGARRFWPMRKLEVSENGAETASQVG